MSESLGSDHEAYPGHHLQVALALERDGLHPISRYFFLSGFGEGWALYTERLADEMGLFSSDVDRAEIDRHIAVPGQATSYMLGNLEIRRLRTESETALGAKFDVRAFHDIVLEDGGMPLWALREKIEHWLASQ